MEKRLTKIGNSLGLVIDKPILDVLGMDQDTPLTIEISSDGQGLLVRRVEGVRSDVVKAARKLTRRYRETLGKLR